MKIGQTGAMAQFTLPGFDLDRFVRDTLAEDLGEGLDCGGRDLSLIHISEPTRPY